MPTRQPRFGTAMQNTKRRPPYGLQLVETFKVRPELMQKDLRVYVGAGAWEFAKHDNHHGFLVLPEGEHAENYAWPVRGRDILVFDTDGSPDIALKRLALELLTAGARVVRVIQHCGNLAVFRP